MPEKSIQQLVATFRFGERSGRMFENTPAGLPPAGIAKLDRDETVRSALRSEISNLRFEMEKRAGRHGSNLLIQDAFRRVSENQLKSLILAQIERWRHG